MKYTITFFLLFHFWLATAQVGILYLKSEPSGAQVTINGEPTGKITPYQEMLSPGEYEITLQAEEYQEYQLKINVEAGKITQPQEIKLEPAFNYVLIKSNPSGAEIVLNGQPIGQVTPARVKIPLGTHRVVLQKAMFNEATRVIQVESGGDQEVIMDLNADYASVAIIASPGDSIFIDDELKGTGRFIGRLNAGSYSLKIQQKNYEPVYKRLNARVGEEIKEVIKLKPITGSLMLMTEPAEAEVWIDGKKYGKTPLIVDSLLVGEYQIELVKNETINTSILNIENRLNQKTLNLASLPGKKIEKAVLGKTSIKTENDKITLTSSIIKINDMFLSEHGHCWSLNPDPKISDSKTSLGSVTEPEYIISVISELPKGKIYFRPYATNRAGTIYGDTFQYFNLGISYNDENSEDEEEIIEEESEDVYTIVDDQPIPVGGMKTLYEYVTVNLQYPAAARRMGIEGKVFVQFIVSETGKVTQVKAVKSIGAGCDEEAERLIKNSHWIPGKKNGKEVKVRMILPITFRL